MKKYVVICVIEREICKVGVTDNPTEATEIMQTDFINELEDNIDIDDFEFGVEYDDCWCGVTSAYLNGRNNYDWEIIEV